MFKKVEQQAKRAIKKLRRSRSLTQKDVAQSMGMSKSRYACIESIGYGWQILLSDAVVIAEFYQSSLGYIAGSERFSPSTTSRLHREVIYIQESGTEALRELSEDLDARSGADSD